VLRVLAAIILTPVLAVLAWLALGEHAPRADFVLASQEPRTLDPARVSWIAEIQLANTMFEGLTRLNSDTFQPEPAVAEYWEADERQTNWTFHLRPDARWSNGEPVTAADFRFSWLRVLDPAIGAQYAGLLFVIDGAEAYYRSRLNNQPEQELSPETVGVEALDEHTLRVRLAAPCSYFLDLTSFPTFAPIHPATVRRWSYQDGRPVPQAQHLWLRPGRIVCNGAFILTHWGFKQSIRLERNPYYWDRSSIDVNSIGVRITADPYAALLAYETGAVDLVHGVESSVARVLMAEQQASRREDFHIGDRFATSFYRVNCCRPPLDSADFRRALSLAIDRAAICEHVLCLGEKPADTYIPPGIVPLMPRHEIDGRTVYYQSPEPLGAGLSYAARLELARSYLKRYMALSGISGVADVRPIELAFGPDPEQRRVAEAVQQMWESGLGLRIELRTLEGKVLSSRLRNLDYDVVRSSWFGDYMDPNTFLAMFTTDNGQNFTGWSNSDYDDLIASAAVEADNERRYAMLSQAEQLLCAECPILTVFHRRGNFLLNLRFAGLKDHPRDLLPLHRVRRVDRVVD
jgi:oligopeptide transport system substrate-binding protein